MPVDCQPWVALRALQMLIMRGLPTLALRMERHSRNALETDRYIDAAPYLDATQKARIREWMGDGIVHAWGWRG